MVLGAVGQAEALIIIIRQTLVMEQQTLAEARAVADEQVLPLL